MAAEAICDGCGKREAMWQDALGKWHKPAHWYQGNTPLGWKIVCGTGCAERICDQAMKTPTFTLNAETDAAWPISGCGGEAIPPFPAVPEPRA